MRSPEAIDAAWNEVLRRHDQIPKDPYRVALSKDDIAAALAAADAIGRERVSEDEAKAVADELSNATLALYEKRTFAAKDRYEAARQSVIALLTAAPAERGDETTYPFRTADEDSVTGPELPGVEGDGPAFSLSEDTYLAADAAAAPAVGVTVDLLDARIEESEEKQRDLFWAAQLPEAGKVLAYREVRALLTAQPEPGTGEEQS